MKYLSIWVISILIFSGCLDFLDEEDENGAPVAVIKIEGNSPFEPDTDIVFSGKGSSDPDNDILEYYWDFDKNDGKDENKIGQISDYGKIIHYYSTENTYTVTLTVSDGDKTASTTKNIKIEQSSSDIRAVVTTNDNTESVMDGEEQISYSFSASNSESDSDIIKYEWDFSYDSSEGFTVDQETTSPEINEKFDSGLYTVKVRITNEMGESDESSYSDDIDLKINYDYETTRTIDTGQQEHTFQLYGLPARYIRATLEYESNSVHTKDLDLYLYNTTQNRNPDDGDDEHVDSNTTHNNDEIEQINIIELDYYNNTDRSWFDEAHELGDWTVVIDHERTGSSEYTLRIEVIYWE